MQERSEQIGALALALALAQGEIRAAIKDSSNPHLKSKYADLASVWDAIRAPLAKNHLAVIQHVSAEGDAVSVTSILAHESGQWMSGTLTLKATKADPQGVGSAITYARRYSLSALVGVAQDDDDGHAASQGNGNGKGRAEKRENGESALPPAKAEPSEHLAAFWEKGKAAFAGREEFSAWLNANKLTLAILQQMNPAQLDAWVAQMPRAESAPPAADGLDKDKVHKAFWAAVNKAKMPEAVAYHIGATEFGWMFDPEKGRASLKATPLPQVVAATRYISDLTPAEVKAACDAHLAGKAA